MKTIYLLFLIAIIGCNTHDIHNYLGESQIEFTTQEKDTVEFTFAFYPENNEYSIKLPIRLSGYVNPENRIYYAHTIDSMTNAVPDKDYKTFNSTQYFRANKNIDSLAITLIRTNKLEENYVTLGILISESDDFKIEPQKNRKLIIKYSAILGRPEWWDYWHERSGLGTYSKKKYELFIREIKVSDLDYMKRDDLSFSEMRALVLKFKYWLLDNPQVEQDGSTMTVKIEG